MERKETEILKLTSQNPKKQIKDFFFPTVTSEALKHYSHCT